MIVYLIMPSQDLATNPTFHYCCFGLLWVLVITSLFTIGFLIVDRERDHIDSDDWKPTNATTARPN